MGGKVGGSIHYRAAIAQRLARFNDVYSAAICTAAARSRDYLRHSDNHRFDHRDKPRDALE